MIIYFSFCLLTAFMLSIAFYIERNEKTFKKYPWNEIVLGSAIISLSWPLFWSFVIYKRIKKIFKGK
ncbi:hypothetical protein CPT_Privateer_038 [Proteus phage Privateer]|uniref:Uncharacterized protein n=1 Tax=Proteus phage Privateer TaxID=2712958 RepID=A0A6G8R3S7_9CAUD|nr:hypothetical protein HWD17_gp038 [Proteus phage Privateer]QIN94831.1 hypothetical protein CPT_Privateer_038 [Proteus phage Privateer]